MKIIYTIALAAFIALFLSACQQELHFPEEKPKNKFTVLADGVNYNLNIDFENVQLGETAHVKLTASSEAYVVTLVSKADIHQNGVGEYILSCCNNDVFEFVSGTRKHWEGDHIGSTRQTGFVKITRMDEKGYAGTYAISAKDGSGRNAAIKEFTGTFEIYY